MSDYQPDTHIEFAFGADPNVTPTSGWADVIADVEAGSISLKNGNEDEQEQAQAESWSFQLTNTDGRYTPDNPHSPHYPHLKLGLPCRIRVGDDVRGVGNVVEISPEWPAGDIETDTSDGWSVVTVTVSGFLRRLGQGEQTLESATTRSWSRRSDAIAYWPMEDESESTSAASPMRGVAAFTPSGVEFAAADGPPGSGQLVRIPVGSSNVMGRVPAHPSSAGYSVQLLWRMDEPPTAGRTMMEIRTTSSTLARWHLRITTTPTFQVRAFDNDGVEVINSTEALDSRVIGQWVMPQLRIVQSGTSVEWSARVLSQFGLPALQSLSDTKTSSTVGRITQAGVAEGTFQQDRYAGHILVLRRTTFPTLLPGVRGYVGERAARRLERLCDEEGLACTIIGDPDTSMPMGPQHPDTLTALLQECADTDGGIFALRRDAFGFMYRCRTDLYNQDPALELDAGTFPGDITHPFTPTMDDQRIRNDVTVQQNGGTSVRVTDEKDIDDRDRFAGEDTVNVAHDGLLELIAGWRLHLGTYSGMRYSSVSPALMQNPDLIPDWAATRLGDRIVVKGLPSQHPTEPVDLLMRGYTDILEPMSWTAEANTTPAAPYRVWELEHETYGRVWSPRPYLATDIDDDDTSFDVIVPVQRPYNPVPDFESEISTSTGFTDDYRVRNGTLTRSKDQAFTGRWSGRFQTAAGSSVVEGLSPQGFIGPTGLTYRGEVWVYSPGASVNAGVDVQWYTGPSGDLPFFDPVEGPIVAVPADTWTRLQVSGPAPVVADNVLGTRMVNRASILLFVSSSTQVVHLDRMELGRAGAPFATSGIFPMSITMGGEVMSVTAIGADDGTGKQTFTVTRGVNGVAKAHARGSLVKLHPGHVHAL